VIVTGSGTTWTQSDRLIVGLFSDGTLSLSDGAVVSSTWSTIGNELSGSGDVVVDGVDSQWIESANMFVGNLGHGTLTIQNGGRVENTWTNIGEQAEGVGSAIVTGGGTTWAQSEGLVVGVAGDGTLSINDGAAVSNTFSLIGSQAKSVGAATVTGSGSTWTNSLQLVVGRAGDGSLGISNGAVVSNTWSSIGKELGGLGVVMVDGIDSQWIQSSNMRVGNFGDGTLTIQNGGQVSNTFTNIGWEAEGVGAATVTGAGTTWSHSQSLVVGRAGNGTLNVNDGAVVSNTWARIGWDINGVGNAFVVGQGTQWLCDEILIVGVEGQGHLTVSGGAWLDTSVTEPGVAGAVIGGIATGNGEVTVTGTNSRWTCTHQMRVGRAGAGTLTVSDGASLDIAMLDPNSNVAALLVSSDTGSVGDVEVTGVGSEITMDKGLMIGFRANTLGTVTISAGASVDLGGSGGSSGLGIFGSEAASSGDLTVTGPGSTYTSVAQLQVAREGSGSLTIADGGHVVTAKATSPTNSSGIVGTLAGSTGTMQVTGAGSLWEQDGGLSVGFWGEGTLDIEAGGVVSSSDGFIARFSGSFGTATVTGSDSNWSVADSFYVGGDTAEGGGSGDLTVANDATVTIGSELKIWGGGLLAAAGGSITVGDAPVADPDVLAIGAGGVVSAPAIPPDSSPLTAITRKMLLGL
jgi:T5SS/PEP-CTERM-associated repeat protein